MKSYQLGEDKVVLVKEQEGIGELAVIIKNTDVESKFVELTPNR